jgi:3-hydroxyisobutyrate dehydrogenase
MDQLGIGRQVEAVIRAMAQHLSDGSIWVDMSISTPEAARVVDDVRTPRGVSRMGAPGSGTGEKRSRRNASDLRRRRRRRLRVRPVRHPGDPDRILHVGGLGTGYTVKVMINQPGSLHLVASAKVLTIGLRAGVDLHTLRSSLGQPSGKQLPGARFAGGVHR